MQQTDTVSPDPIMKLGTAFFSSKTLLSAIELRLFTELAEGPLTYADLKRRLGLHDRAARDFFDALVSLGLLKRANERYANTPATDLYLDRRKDTYLGAYLEMANNRLFGYWNHLTAALKTGLPQNEHGQTDAFEKIYSTPESVENFVNEMHDVSLPLVQTIAKAFPWSDYRTVIDVGTCKGAFPVALMKAWPHLSGGGFDLPQVQAPFERYVAKNGLSDRARFYPGNFHNDSLPSADVLVMGHILVDWDVATKKMLISKAAQALRPGGVLIIYEMVLDDDRRYNAAGLLMSLNMAIETTGGGNRTGQELMDWMRDAGFSSARVVRLSQTHSMVIGER